MIAITGGVVLTPTERLDPGVVLVEGGRITAVDREEELTIPEKSERTDAAGGFVAPGLIDLHTHGLLGHDVMGPGLAEAIAAYPQYGVTSFLATTLTSPRGRTEAALAEMAAVLSAPPAGAVCLGIHLEGPHLSPARPGIANPEYFEPLTWEGFERLHEAADGLITMITLAPERVEPLEILGRLREVGVLPAVGHSDATFDQMSRAVSSGLNHASHTFNAMRPFHHREPGVVGAVLHHSSIFAEVIADGVHVHPSAIQLLLRLKGLDRTVLVSDSAPLAGKPPGRYEWAGRTVRIRDGRCELEDGTLAGAASPLDVGPRLLHTELGLEPSVALTPATLTPAAAIEVGTKGRLAPGLDADLILLDGHLRPSMTMVAGETVWSEEK